MKSVIVLLAALSLLIGAMPLAAKRLPRSPLDGVWTTDCQPIGKNGRHGFITRLEVKGRRLTATSQIYAHNSCDTATVRTAYRGEIVRTVAGSDGAVDLDHIVLTVTMTADAPDVVATYNADDKSGCGMGGGWVLGVARSVAGVSAHPGRSRRSARRSTNALGWQATTCGSAASRQCGTTHRPTSARRRPA